MSTLDMDRTIPNDDRRAAGWWLVSFAVMVFTIILVGGATRLTESGLSITEWKPVSGVLPPVGEAQWNAEFAKYRLIPQYQQLNAGMTLSEFRQIYLWEYGHRLAARFVGLAFLVPMVWFLVRRRIPSFARHRIVGLFALLAVQGAMGWWMVKSGLVGRTEVSQYRLALHLTTAFGLLALTVWTAADLLVARAAPAPGRQATGATRVSRWLGGFVALAMVTSASGALVAGLRAGRIFNTFPLMAGRVVPPGYAQLAPGWRNAFENPAAAQFHHRVLAVTTFLAAVVLWTMLRRSPDRSLVSRMHLVLGAAMLQLTLGILTLLHAVPVSLGVAHQGGAAILLVTAVLAWHASRPRMHEEHAGDHARVGVSGGIALSALAPVHAPAPAPAATGLACR